MKVNKERQQAGKADTDQPLFSKEELVGLAEPLFRVKPEVMHGALSGHARERFTMSETKEIIQQFLQRKVCK